MLLVVSGASGVGKSTARIKVAAELGDEFEAVELYHLDQPPASPTMPWRQRTVETAVQRAIALDKEGRHLLLCGDPVPAGEVLAAPSADQIDVSVCLLDADETAQTERIREREEPPEVMQLHLMFAEWLRKHATDPSHRPHVLTHDSWDKMQWDRWMDRPDDGSWAMRVIDTSRRESDDVATQVLRWCRDSVAGQAPVFRAGWFR